MGQWSPCCLEFLAWLIRAHLGAKCLLDSSMDLGTSWAKWSIQIGWALCFFFLYVFVPMVWVQVTCTKMIIKNFQFGMIKHLSITWMFTSFWQARVFAGCGCASSWSCECLQGRAEGEASKAVWSTWPSDSFRVWFPNSIWRWKINWVWTYLWQLGFG